MPDRPAPLVVAIDGPAGSGKSTLARALAAALGWAFLDTGALYRAVTLVALRRGLALDDGPALAALARGLAIDADPRGPLRVDGEDVVAAVRGPAVDRGVSVVAAHAEVRAVMRDHQRAFAARNGRVVAEGRDIGTAVFPDAALKVFLTGSEEERVRRRVAELQAKEAGLDPGEVARALRARDDRDRGRTVDPLREAPDAVPVDTTGLSPGEVLAAVLALVRSRIPPSAAR